MSLLVAMAALLAAVSSVAAGPATTAVMRASRTDLGALDAIVPAVTDKSSAAFVAAGEVGRRTRRSRPRGRAGPGGARQRPVIEALGRAASPRWRSRAYKGAERTRAGDDPACGLRWTLLAAIGRVESNHGRFGGAQLREDGYGTKPIRGIPLDGRPNVALIRDTDEGALDGDTTYDRAVGPMQFIPSTWRGVCADGNGDDRRDPNNIFDAAQGAGGVPVRR